MINSATAAIAKVVVEATGTTQRPVIVITKTGGGRDTGLVAADLIGMQINAPWIAGHINTAHSPHHGQSGRRVHLETILMRHA